MNIYFKLVMFPDITHIKVNNGCKAAFILFYRVEMFQCLHPPPPLKPHILFNSNGLTICTCFPDITHVKKKILQSAIMAFAT